MWSIPVAGRAVMRAAPALLLLLLLVPAAGAHATLQSAEPAPNSHADLGIERVTIRFTEDVERDFTSADIRDEQMESWAAGPVTFDANASNVIHLPTRPLADGVYSVSWRALSVDTHTTRGVFLFAVGNATLEYHPPVEAQDPYTAGVGRDGFARAVYYGGLVIALGLPAFALFVVRDATTPRALLGTIAAAASVGALAAGVNLLFLADRTGLSLVDAANTTPGTGLLWRGGLLAIAALLAAVAFARPAPRRALAYAILLAAGAAIVMTVASSHAAAASEDRALLMLADAAHLAMAGLWIGGVIGFLHVGRGRSLEELAAMVIRFSPLAVGSVVILLATGLFASLAHVPCLTTEIPMAACAESFRTESYVRLVAAKLALMVPLILIGAYNKLVAGPRLARGQGLSGFRRLVQVEAVVMALVLLAAGVLAATSPPDKDVQDVPTYAPAALELQNVTAKSHVIVQLTPNPVRVGIQELVVMVHPLGGRLPNATLVMISVQGPGEPESETLTPLERTAPGEWSGRDAFFTSAGTWKLHVVVDRGDEYKKLTFEVPVVTQGSP